MEIVKVESNILKLFRIRKIEEQYKYASGKQYDYVVELIIGDTFYSLVNNEEIEFKLCQ